VKDFPGEAEWAAWMRAGIAGDAAAYRRFLEAVTPYLRGLARRHCVRYGSSSGDSEDVVQETLLAIHLKRGTWDATRPIGPWIATIARHKLIDALRRGGRRLSVPIDEVMDTLEAQTPADGLDSRDADRLLAQLSDRQREVVRSISVEALSARETAQRLGMSEGAVRVALHRALKSLAALYKDDSH
jgi:RNA polymerase sigma-70 factor (ECF subfamily)